MTSPAVVIALARSFLAGELSVDAAHARAVQTLGQEWRFLRSLAERYVAAVSSEARVRPRHRDVVGFLFSDRGFREAMVRHREKLQVAHWLVEPQRMRPVAAARAWGLPEIETAGDLADFLSLLPSELEWFADLKRLNPKARSPQLQHYRYRVVAKRPGGFRLIESPKRDLRDIQRRVLDRILNLVPAHPAAHGFVRGRSIVSCAAPHSSQAAVLRLDLENFFPAFPAARASAIFRTFGYPEPVADRLAALCTNSAPRSVWRERPAASLPRRGSIITRHTPGRICPRARRLRRRWRTSRRFGSTAACPRWRAPRGLFTRDTPTTWCFRGRNRSHAPPGGSPHARPRLRWKKASA